MSSLEAKFGSASGSGSGFKSHTLSESKALWMLRPKRAASFLALAALLVLVQAVFLLGSNGRVSA